MSVSVSFNGRVSCCLFKIHRIFLTISCVSGMTGPSRHLPAQILENFRKTRARCEICSKLAIKTPKLRHWRRSGVFIVNFEHISHFVPKFLLLTLNM